MTKSSHHTVYTASYTIEDLLDTRLIWHRGKHYTLRLLLEDHAWDNAPGPIHNAVTDCTLETTVDGDHIDVAFIR